MISAQVWCVRHRDGWCATKDGSEAARRRMDAYVNGGHKCGPHGGA